jgi:hypothetical protein
MTEQDVFAAAADLAFAWPVEQAARALCSSRLAEMTSNNPMAPERLADAVQIYWPEYVDEVCLVIEALAVTGTAALALAEGAPGRRETGRRLVEAARRALPHWRELAAAERELYTGDRGKALERVGAGDRKRVAKGRKEAKAK